MSKTLQKVIPAKYAGVVTGGGPSGQTWMGHMTIEALPLSDVPWEFKVTAGNGTNRYASAEEARAAAVEALTAILAELQAPLS
jgi:hypothetical protein